MTTTIVTARRQFDDSFTITRALATGAYGGLKKALAMTPEAVCSEVDQASLLGRGGAGFPTSCIRAESAMRFRASS